MTLNVAPEAYERATEVLKQGGIVAYPTEAVYGLGCDPFNESAVNKLLKLKQRSVDKGLILICDNWEACLPLVDINQLDDKQLKKIMTAWPGPVTWVFPVSNKVPPWIKGKHESIAIRITAHEQAKTLCQNFEGPIVSTSANISQSKMALDNLEVYDIFKEEVDYILPGRVGDLEKPTEIKDALTGKIIRKG